MEQCPLVDPCDQSKASNKDGQSRRYKTPEVKQHTSRKKTQKMSWLLFPETSGETLCGLSLLILAVFLPIRIITNCMYHPEDLGPFRPVCFEDNYEVKIAHDTHCCSWHYEQVTPNAEKKCKNIFNTWQFRSTKYKLQGNKGEFCGVDEEWFNPHAGKLYLFA